VAAAKNQGYSRRTYSYKHLGIIGSCSDDRSK
jgi:hypothetical protein